MAILRLKSFKFQRFLPLAGFKILYFSNFEVRLGRNILDFSKQSNMEKEKVEDLAINGDVWRSKYLAASVLTDELITTKVQLLRHLRDGQTAVRQLLEEQECVRRHLIQSAALLSQIKSRLSLVSIAIYSSVLSKKI